MDRRRRNRDSHLFPERSRDHGSQSDGGMPSVALEVVSYNGSGDRPPPVPTPVDTAALRSRLADACVLQVEQARASERSPSHDNIGRMVQEANEGIEELIRRRAEPILARGEQEFLERAHRVCVWQPPAVRLRVKQMLAKRSNKRGDYLQQKAPSS